MDPKWIFVCSKRRIDVERFWYFFVGSLGIMAIEMIEGK
jgi:hypothetical protein